MTQKTIRVRLAAVVTADGKWSAYGFNDCERQFDWTMIEENVDPDGNYPPQHRIWITADLPIPDHVLTDVEARDVEVAPAPFCGSEA